MMTLKKFTSFGDSINIKLGGSNKLHAYFEGALYCCPHTGEGEDVHLMLLA